MLFALFLFLWLIWLNISQHFILSHNQVFILVCFLLFFLICISFDFTLIFIASFPLPLLSLVYFSFSCFLSYGVVSFKLFFLMWIIDAINPTFRAVLVAYFTYYTSIFFTTFSIFPFNVVPLVPYIQQFIVKSPGICVFSDVLPELSTFMTWW